MAEALKGARTTSADAASEVQHIDLAGDSRVGQREGGEGIRSFEEALESLGEVPRLRRSNSEEILARNEPVAY